MRTPPTYVHRILTGPFASTPSDGSRGAFYTDSGLRIISTGDDLIPEAGGWEHVSVSRAERTPTWDEMQKVKQWFWDDSDVVVQFHIDDDSKVNFHAFCLHLWRKQDGTFPTPPKGCV